MRAAVLLALLLGCAEGSGDNSPSVADAGSDARDAEPSRLGPLVDSCTVIQSTSCNALAIGWDVPAWWIAQYDVACTAPPPERAGAPCEMFSFDGAPVVWCCLVGP